MNATALPPAGASPALAAFLRGSGRRALLFAQLQCGDPVRGDLAAIASLSGFAAIAMDAPMAQWPRRFWAGLLADPRIRAEGAARWPDAFALLGSAGPGARAALLLWLVAGLGEEDAAAALGVAVPAWRLALRRAAPHDAEGALDAMAWRALEDEVREALRALPAARLEAWERACGRVLQGVAPHAPTKAPVGRTPTLPPTPSRRWAWPVAALAVLALAVTFVLPRSDRSAGVPGDDAGTAAVVRSSPLPAAAAPPAFAPGEQAALLLHPEFELLADGGDAPLLRELAFNAWYAAQRVDTAAAGEGADAAR